MEIFPTSLFTTKDLTDSQIKKIFQLTFQLKCHFLEKKEKSQSWTDVPDIYDSSSFLINESSLSETLLRLKEKSLLVLQAFFEPSTRTKISFEIAAQRLGLSVLTQDFVFSSSSQQKGESLTDTLEVLVSMRPDLFVIRYDGSENIKNKLKSLSCPLINAGAGQEAHPTQALLDAFTIEEVRRKRGKISKSEKILEGEKILFVGDICHSRVASSQKLLFERLGAQVAVTGPAPLIKEHSNWEKSWKNCVFFPQLKEGLKWCTVCVALRWQNERHSSSFQRNLQKQGLNLKAFQLNHETIKALSSQCLILHPGPVNWGKEMSLSLKENSRFQALKQVTNGVFLRMSLLFFMLS